MASSAYRQAPNDELTRTTRDSFERSVAFILIATPAVFAILTFQTVPDFNLLSRRLSTPVRLAEALIVLLAIRDGFNFKEAWQGLSRWTRTASAVWAASVIIAALFATRDPVVARILAVGTLLHGILALALYDRLRIRPQSALALIRAGSTGLACYALIAIVYVVVVFDRPDFPWPYLGVGVTNVRQIGFYGLPLLGASLGLLALARTHREKRNAFLLLVLGMFLVLWCGGRATAIGAGAAVGVAFTLAAVGTRMRLLGLTALAGLVSVPAAHFLAPAAQYGPRNLIRLVSAPASADFDDYSSSRLQFWRWTMEDIVQQPLIGHGEGQFAQMIYEHVGHVFNHPHNFVLQATYEWGVLGFATLAVLVARVLLGALRLRASALAEAVPALAGLAGLGTTSLMDGSLYYPMPLVSAILFLAVIATRSPTPSHTASAPERRLDPSC